MVRRGQVTTDVVETSQLIKVGFARLIIEITDEHCLKLVESTTEFVCRLIFLVNRACNHSQHYF